MVRDPNGDLSVRLGSEAATRLPDTPGNLSGVYRLQRQDGEAADFVTFAMSALRLMHRVSFTKGSDG
jgi:hypothetical protein